MTSAVDNLDESGRCEFHGTAMTLTSHPTHDTLGEDPPPLSLDPHEGAPVQLPNDYAIVPMLMNMLVTLNFLRWIRNRPGQHLMKVSKQGQLRKHG